MWGSDLRRSRRPVSIAQDSNRNAPLVQSAGDPPHGRALPGAAHGEIADTDYAAARRDRPEQSQVVGKAIAPDHAAIETGQCRETSSGCPSAQASGLPGDQFAPALLPVGPGGAHGRRSPTLRGYCNRRVRPSPLALLSSPMYHVVITLSGPTSATARSASSTRMVAMQSK